MTFPCKEEYMQFETIARKMRPLKVGKDTVTGLPFAEVDLEARRIDLNELLQVYKKPEYGYVVRKGDKYSNLFFRIPIEIDEGCEVGYQMRIDSYKDSKVEGGGYMAVLIRSYRKNIETGQVTVLGE